LNIILNRELSSLVKDDRRPTHRSTLKWAYQRFVKEERKAIEQHFHFGVLALPEAAG
jgi:hypothetical protein